MSIVSNNHIILDTCFIIKAYEYSNTPYFNELFEYLAGNHCIPIINDLINFEFLKGCKKQIHRKIKEDYLNSFVAAVLPCSNEIIKNATVLSNLYSNKNINNNQISFVDLCNAAFLKKHKDLLLITLDNNDYPLCVHDRLEIYTIDTEKEVLSFGIYKFNFSKFETVNADFAK
ncbi:MAG: hypothetical protein HY931_03215 [Candidatus Falkowbacteria bacterium]|nr:MAG: hypothetical protein HY931_03215 [Candidatus Falkowbacteria bacterium]